jgi:uncharacterized protein (TIGR02594 family)
MPIPAEFPKGYEWLASAGQLPRTITEGVRLLGVAEVVGKGANATILSWRDELNAAGVKILGYSDDDIPWCGLFAAIVAHRAGKQVPQNPLWARNWTKFGTQQVKAGLGDVLVFERPGGGGHVGFYIGEDRTAFHVLGGNQGNAVTITRIRKERCIAVRRPEYTAPPASARRFELAVAGPLSSNEA